MSAARESGVPQASARLADVVPAPDWFGASNGNSAMPVTRNEMDGAASAPPEQYALTLTIEPGAAPMLRAASSLSTSSWSLAAPKPPGEGEMSFPRRTVHGRARPPDTPTNADRVGRADPIWMSASSVRTE